MTTNKELSQKLDQLTDAVLKLVEIQTKPEPPKSPIKAKKKGRPKGSKNTKAKPAVEIATEIPQSPPNGVDLAEKSAIIQSGRIPSTRIPKSNPIANGPEKKQKQCHVTSFQVKRRDNKFVQFMGGESKLAKAAAKDRHIDQLLSGNIELTDRGERTPDIVEAQCQRCKQLFDIPSMCAEYDEETRRNVFICDNCVTQAN